MNLPSVNLSSPGLQMRGVKVDSYVAFHFLVLGLLTWVTGEAFLLPSLGPSVFVLATVPDHEINFPYRVVVGHLVAVSVSFLVAQFLLGAAQSTPQFQALSVGALLQVVGTLVALTVATLGMFVTDAQHPPAYATTLLVALGIVTTLLDVAVFMLAVFVIVGVHELVGKRLPIWNLPYKSGR